MILSGKPFRGSHQADISGTRGSFPGSLSKKSYDFPLIFPMIFQVENYSQCHKICNGNGGVGILTPMKPASLVQLRGYVKGSPFDFSKAFLPARELTINARSKDRQPAHLPPPPLDRLSARRPPVCSQPPARCPLGQPANALLECIIS